MLPILAKIHEEGEYEPTIKDVRKWFDILNAVIFDGRVPKFSKIRIKNVSGQIAAACPMHDHSNQESRFCNLEIHSKFRSFQFFITILAHEMVHSYQWLVERRSQMSHGPSFFSWRARLAEHHIPLHIKYDTKAIDKVAVKVDNPGQA